MYDKYHDFVGHVERPADDNVWRVSWNSVSDLFRDSMETDYAANRSNAFEIERQLAAWDSAADSFTSGYTTETLKAALKSVPANVAQAIEKARAALIGEVPLPTAPRRRRRRGLDCGDDINADAFLAFDPNCWERMQRESTAKPTVRLGVNVAALAHRTFDDCVYRGAAVVALADHLIARGLNVEIVATACSENITLAKQTVYASVVVKPADAPLDIATVALMLCEVAAFRMTFLVARARPIPFGGWNDYAGRTRHAPATDRAKFDFYADSDLLGERQSLEWLKACLRQVDAQAAEVVQ